MFFADILDTFGITLPGDLGIFWPGDRITQLKRTVRASERELLDLRTRLVGCRRRIEILRDEGRGTRDEGRISLGHTTPPSSLVRLSADFKRVDGERATRLQHTEHLYRRILSRTITVQRQLALLRRQLSKSDR
jgi:hypothetical protein